MIAIFSVSGSFVPVSTVFRTDRRSKPCFHGLFRLCGNGVTGSEELAHASRCRNEAASFASKRTVVLQEAGSSPKKRRKEAAYRGETYQGGLVPGAISIGCNYWIASL